MRNRPDPYAHMDYDSRQGALVVNTSYDPGFVSAIKSLPSVDRKFDPTSKCWMVAPQHAQTVAGWIEQFYGIKTSFVPATFKARTEDQIFEVHYIGSTKERNHGEPWTAFGNTGKEWNLIFPETVLQNWFNGVVMEDERRADPSKAANLYQVLLLTQAATDEEVKKAYKRLAMQWHPDHCHETNAQDVFIKIKDAYDVLINPNKRSRYDLGLAMEAQAGKVNNVKAQGWSMLGMGYQPALRCGWVMARGQWIVGRFYISQILGWEDITDSNGKTLISSWPKGADMWIEEWL